MDSNFKYSFRDSTFPDNSQGNSSAAGHPNLSHTLDEEAKRHDDTSEGIDWDEIIATTQDDWTARRFGFNTADYPTDEAAMAALEKWMDEILKDVPGAKAPVSSYDAASQ